MGKKYDVLILCQFFHPEVVSSAILPFETAEDLVKKGLNVKVLCGMPKNKRREEKPLSKETINGIEIKRLKYAQLPKASKIGRLINYFSFLFAIILNWPRLINNKCTLVYSNPPVLPVITSINKGLFKVKYIFVSYDIYPDIALMTKQIKQNSFLHKLMNSINNRVDRNADRIIALSHDMKTYILKNRRGFDDSKITVIPNWYDNNGLDVLSEIEDDEIVALRKKYSLIILYSGNMGIAQDIQTIIDVAKSSKNNKEILFIFTGSGQKVEHLKSEIHNYQLNNVKFYKFLTGAKYIDMLKASDMHVITLINGLEGMAVPSKTYSYMAVGRPIIALMNDNTDIAKDIKLHNLGCVIKSGNVEKFLDYIRYLQNNKTEIEKIGKRVRNVFSENYTREMCTAKYYEVIAKTIA